MLNSEGILNIDEVARNKFAKCFLLIDNYTYFPLTVLRIFSSKIDCKDIMMSITYFLIRKHMKGRVQIFLIDHP